MAQVSRVRSGAIVIGSHSLQTSFTTSGTHTTFQDEGLSISVTYGANRVLRVSLYVTPYSPGGIQAAQYQVLRTSTQVLQAITPALIVANGQSFTYSRVFNGPATAATETFKVQLKALTANTSVASFGAANGFDRQLLIEDLGPQ